ncbi:hypothetical protein PRUPE_2G015700 [Prunus persica]|uniref:Uncharacterized protein n=1 Tax=Prunus persica TaxID=3760 RepID=A0A251QAL4_PRUPE|nr:hypothetical protein PRUPE_2G015700 [Prunus persica]
MLCTFCVCVWCGVRDLKNPWGISRTTSSATIQRCLWSLMISVTGLILRTAVRYNRYQAVKDHLKFTFTHATGHLLRLRCQDPSSFCKRHGNGFQEKEESNFS